MSVDKIYNKYLWVVYTNILLIRLLKKKKSYECHAILLANIYVSDFY